MGSGMANGMRSLSHYSSEGNGQKGMVVGAGTERAYSFARTPAIQSLDSWPLPRPLGEGSRVRRRWRWDPHPGTQATSTCEPASEVLTPQEQDLGGSALTPKGTDMGAQGASLSPLSPERRT